MTDKTLSVLSADKKSLIIDEIISYFSTEKDIELGQIAAEEILEFFLKTLNREIYNQALDDSQTIIRQGMENIIVNVGSLSKT